MVQIFFYLQFSLIFLFQVNYPLFYSHIYLFISGHYHLFSSVKSMTKILLGIPLFSLLFIVFARIGICTIEVTANTQQVLAVPAQTAKLLQLHIPSRFISCRTGFVYRMLWQSLIEVSILNGLTFLKQLTVLLSKREGPMASSKTFV